MYAIIQSGGKQYRVSEGDLVQVERFPEGTQNVEFSDVFLVGNGQDTLVGSPLVQGARVKGTVVQTGRWPKVLVFKMKRRKQYKRTIGHRQDFTAVRIDEIDSGGAIKPLEGAAKKPTPRKKAVTKKKTKTGAKKKTGARAAAGKKTTPRKAATGGKKAATKKAAPAARKKTTTKKKSTDKK